MSMEKHWIHFETARRDAEEAYKVLKVLVEKKVIKEPDSFNEFCKLIETTAIAIKS